MQIFFTTNPYVDQTVLNLDLSPLSNSLGFSLPLFVLSHFDSLLVMGISILRRIAKTVLEGQESAKPFLVALHRLHCRSALKVDVDQFLSSEGLAAMEG